MIFNGREVADSCGEGDSPSKFTVTAYSGPGCGSWTEGARLGPSTLYRSVLRCSGTCAGVDGGFPYRREMRLTADADPARWVPVTESLGWKGRRHRKAAIRMLLGQAFPGPGATPGGAPRRPSSFAAWALSQAAPLLLRKADGRVLVWTWKDNPELLLAVATAQELTPQLRAAQAMMPMEYDDTETFRNPYLGSGEKLMIALPQDPNTPPFATYTWDTGTHMITLQAVCPDRQLFGTFTGALDDLARTLRRIDDTTVHDGSTVLRIDPL